MARAVAAWDARRVWADDGATSATAWLAHRCELSRSSAATLVRTARRSAVDAVDRGRVPDVASSASRRRCCLASAAHRSDKTLEVFARDEEMLVDHACRLTVDQTALMLRHWLLRADPDGGRGDARRRRSAARVDRRSTARPRSTACYTSEDGAVIKAAVDAEYERLWRAERASGGPTRTAAQRRAAALAEVVRRAVGAEPGRPTIAVTIGLDDLDDATGSRPRRRHRRTRPPPRPRGAWRATPASSRSCSAAPSEPLDVGRASRSCHPRATPSAHRLRDRGCVFPGCDRPPGWCDGHHIVHWADGGPTDMANLALLCNHHHNAMHEGGWTMARAPDGSLTLHPTRRHAPARDTTRELR